MTASQAAVAHFLESAEVEWEGTADGLTPHVAGAGERLVGEMGKDDVAILVEALDDVDAFVKAHVALTWLSGVEHETFPTWNGLPVDIAPDGAARVDLSGQTALAGRWRRWFEQRPRPSRLPE